MKKFFLPLFLLAISAPIYGESERDPADYERRRLIAIQACKSNGGEVKEDSEEVKDQGDGLVCQKKTVSCKEKGKTGYIEVAQAKFRCAKLTDDYECDENGKCNKKRGGGGGGGGDGERRVVDRESSCTYDNGCDCAYECSGTKNRDRRECRKCLDKSHPCLGDIMDGRRRSCEDRGVVYECTDCKDSDRGGRDRKWDEDLYQDAECHYKRQRKCDRIARREARRASKRGGGDYTVCENCQPRPKGEGLFNVLNGLGNFVMKAGIGVGASGLMNHLNVKECRKWYQSYNDLRVASSQNTVDWNCSGYAGANAGGGLFSGGNFNSSINTALNPIGAGLAAFGGTNGSFLNDFLGAGVGAAGYNPYQGANLLGGLTFNGGLGVGNNAFYQYGANGVGGAGVNGFYPGVNGQFQYGAGGNFYGGAGAGFNTGAGGGVGAGYNSARGQGFYTDVGVSGQAAQQAASRMLNFSAGGNYAPQFYSPNPNMRIFEG